MFVSIGNILLYEQGKRLNEIIMRWEKYLFSLFGNIRNQDRNKRRRITKKFVYIYIRIVIDSKIKLFWPFQQLFSPDALG